MKNKKAAASGDALKGKCFYCNEKGHWKPQCPKLLAKKQDRLLELRCYLSELDRKAGQKGEDRPR
ncbi:hypothetical protein CsatB_003191 [Cannabis sativa]